MIRRVSNFTTVVVKTAIGLFALILVHSFYSRECCGGHDCHEVPCEQIIAVEDGWKWANIFFTRGTLKISHDGGCHVCVPDNALTGTCIYLPPRV